MTLTPKNVALVAAIAVVAVFAVNQFAPTLLAPRAKSA